MAFDLMNLVAKLSLDKSEYDSGLREASSGIDKTLGTAAKVGAAAVAAATTAVVGFSASSVKVGADFDSAMSQVAATMGKSMDEVKDEVGEVDTSFGTFKGNLRDFAQFLGSNTAFSATQAAEALNYMALAGYDTQKSMDMLPNVLSLAAAGSMDLARASDMITDSQTAFGISAERTTQMVDEMAKAASTGNTSVEQLGDAFLVVGGLAQDLNGGMVTLANGTQKPVDGVQELEIALTAMANAGVKGSEAGTHMRNMLLKLSSPTDAGTIALEKLGVAVFDDEGKMRSLNEIFGDLSTSMEDLTQEEKIQAISDLFNVRDVASAEALLNAVGQDWDKIGESILNAEGAAAKMAETQLDNLAGDVTLFKSALEGTQIALSDGLTPTIRKVVQAGTQGLSKVTTKIQEYLAKEETQKKLEKIGNAVEKLMNIILDHLDDIFDIGIKVITGIMDALGFLIENIGTVKTVIAAVLAAWGTIKAAGIIATISKVIPVITSIIGAAGGIAPVITALINPVTLVVAAVAAAAVAIIANWDKIKEAWGKAVEFFKGVWEGIKGAFSSVKSWITQRFKDAWSGVKTAWGKTKDFFSNRWTDIKNAFSNVKTWIGEKFSSAKTAVTDKWKDIGSKFAGWRDNIYTALKNVGTNISDKFTGAYTRVKEWWKDIGSVFGGFADDVKGAFANLPEDFLEVGHNLMEGLKNGITERITSVVNKVKEFGGNILDAINRVFGNASPSKEFKKIGGYLMQGLAIGIDDNIGLVEDAMGELEDMTFAEVPTTDLATDTSTMTTSYDDGTGYFTVPRQAEQKQLTVILELDRMVLGRTVYNLNNEETQRVGVRLAGVGGIA